MRWEDERYVRIYTRDTADWLALSFDAQALFCLLLRKVDRAGLLPLGKHGKRAVAAVIGQVSLWTRLEPALEELLADGCIRLERDVLVVPNFVEAQEASMSDRQRKAEQRARDRDQAGKGRDQSSRNVTAGHEESREVTTGHTESQTVTPCRAVPCRAEPTEDAAATRASARSDGTQLGSEVGAPSLPPSAAEPASEPGLMPRPAPEVAERPAGEAPVVASPAGGGEATNERPGTAGPGEVAPGSASASNLGPAAPGHPAEAATSEAHPRLRAVPLVEDDAPLRPVPTLDTTELDELGATLRWRLERRAEWKFLVAAHDRRAEVRAKLETMVEALGVDRAEALCWSVLERRKSQDLQPPKAMAFFLGLLEEAAKGGDPMPAEVAGVDVNQVLAARDAEIERRWSPLLERMNPSQRESYEAEKARLGAEVRGLGLWTSEETRQLQHAEEFLFTKWSRKTAAGEA